METEKKRTNEVMEKWGIDENMSQQDLQKAAEMFAKIQVRNRFLKRTAFFGVTIVVVFLALMLGSVILGAEITKEFKVKNEILVQKSGNGSALQTSEVSYSVNLNLLTPLSTVKGIKSIKFVDKSDGSIVQFKVVSFYYIYGRNLTLYGDKYVANVLGNGNIEFYPISNNNGVRSIDESRVIKKTEDDDDLEIISTYGNGNQNDVTSIYDCAGLSNIQSTGKFALMNNINCNLSQPLLPSGFFGTFNGRGYTITLNMERNGPVALFTSVGSTSKIANLFIAGNLNGKGNCSAFAIEAYVGAKFLSSAVYATITCGNINDDLDDYTSLGGFAAVLRNPNNVDGYISFLYSVNQGFFNSISSNENKISYTGGFYARTGRNEYLDRRFNFTYSATNFTRYGNNSHVNRFGFKYVFVSTTVAPTRLDRGKRDDPYIPEDCYNFDDTNINYINMCIAWYLIWWFENYDCCSDFHSCPYISCNLYSQVCDYCIHYKRSPQGPKEQTVEKIVPVTPKLCDFDH